MRNYKKTIIGLSLIIGLLITSLLYPSYGSVDFAKVDFLYDKKGDIIGVPPIPPSSYYLLGSDRNGASMALMLLYGAKFTILLGIIVTLLRVIIGGALGIIFSLWLKPFLLALKDFLLVYKLVPPIVITLLLMYRVSSYIGEAVYGIMFYQIVVLVIVGIPSVIITTSEIMGELSQKSYVLTSYLMGGSHFHVLKRQIKPFLSSYAVLIAVQQLLNTFILVMYLGIFEIYIGGTARETVRGLESFISNSKEWAGLIGQNFDEFYRVPYLVFIPLGCYVILLLVINLIKKELEERIDIFTLPINRRMGKTKATLKERVAKDENITVSDFTLQSDLHEHYERV